MSGNKEKQFSIRQVFTNLSSVSAKQTINGDVVKRFGVFWKIQLFKCDDGDIVPFLFSESFETGDWSISGLYDVIVGGKSFQAGLQFQFTQNKPTLNPYYISRKVQITVTKITFQLPKLRSFDDDYAKKYSDIICLLVGNRKFYVERGFLAYHSSYFNSLFFGNFSETEKSIIELKDIDQEDLQNFLNVLYGESVIDDDTVEGILKLSGMYDAKTARRRCEEFLLGKSKNSRKIKFTLAGKYKLDALKKKCLSGLKTTAEVRELVPENVDDFSPSVWKELFLKATSPQ
ncbi:unnamed protein product [Caenorhabditis nigoni]